MWVMTSMPSCPTASLHTHAENAVCHSTSLFERSFTACPLALTASITSLAISFSCAPSFPRLIRESGLSVFHGCRQATGYGVECLQPEAFREGKTAMKRRYENRIELLQGTLDLLILQTLQWG